MESRQLEIFGEKQLNLFGRAGQTVSEPFLGPKNTQSSPHMHEVTHGLSHEDEIVESGIGYPDGFQPRSIEAQLEIWELLFPYLDRSFVMDLASRDLPLDAEGWGVVPKIDRVGSQYLEALEVMLKIIASRRGFKNFCDGKLGKDYFKLSARTSRELDYFDRCMQGDFYVFPVQFGKLWRGASTRYALMSMRENEFALGPYEVACLFVTHPDRITGIGQLYLRCAGGEYSPKGDKYFENNLIFDWFSAQDRMALLYSWHGHADPEWGIATAFCLLGS